MAELQKGIPLLFQQFKALLKKNFLLSSRHKKSTFFQLFSSFFFLLIIFCIERANHHGGSTTNKAYDPVRLVAPSIPSCEDNIAVKLPCFDFVWSGNYSAKVQSIVGKIMANNPGRSIPSNKVKSFGTPDEVDAWLINDPMPCPGALHFVERNASIISYGIQTNSTVVSSRRMDRNPTLELQFSLQVAAEREIARSIIGDPNFSWVVGLKEFKDPNIKSSVSPVESVGPTFFFAIAMFGFVFQTGSLVLEKELKLRQAMSMMGLYETSYWLSWLTWETAITLISSLFTVTFGLIFQLNFFRHNNVVILFLVFFLFQLNMIGFAFMISNFISKASSATTLGFFIFIVGFITQLVTTTSGFPYRTDTKKKYQIIWSLFPPNLLAKAIDLLGKATDPEHGKGFSWRARGKCLPADDECVITMDGIYKWLISTFFVWMFVAIYLDNIFPNSYGVRKSLLYFLNPGYWTGKGGNRVAEGGLCSCTSSIPPPEDAAPDDEDVREEERMVKQLVSEGIVDPNVAVQIRGLAKSYPGRRGFCCCCCKCEKTPPFHAIRGLWVNLAKNQLFCLLGPNGAGKTTAINCLTGIAPVTSGDALIYGYSIRNSVGMSNIRRMIGVCPQFDILWADLSAEEHLHLFASIKGLPPSSIKSVAEKSLADVKLMHAEKIRAGSYSGGMKRRLSVAIALIGDPKLVILDEPTTGMDPITRRHVWDIIEDAKKGRALVLTTHSMEEADILSDRIAIMAKGKLRCIGNSIRLKSRFGSGFVASVSFNAASHEQSPNVDGNVGATSEIHHDMVKQFFRQRLNVIPKEENKAFMTFVIPHEKESLLADFFAELEDRQRQFGISDIQLGLTTLEEVFLNIAKKAELQSALAEGISDTLTLTSRVKLQVPKGARFVGIPGTESAQNPSGLMVEVYWEQDEQGALCITGCSSETAIPPNVRPMASSGLTPPRTFLGRKSPVVHGLVIDPNDIEISTR